MLPSSGLPGQLHGAGRSRCRSRDSAGAARRSGQDRERTCFQTHARWDPMLQLRSDVAICYGIDRPARADRPVEGTGLHPPRDDGRLLGQYQDYLYGRFDGKKHVDEAQTDRNGHVISHGGDVYYMSPGRELRQVPLPGRQAGDGRRGRGDPPRGARVLGPRRLRRGLQARVEVALPRGLGRRRTPRPTPSIARRCSSIISIAGPCKQVFDFVKAENARTGRQVKCYVPTHSLINYAHWKIVSPESSLVEVGADGFIAQVWTGTARTPNVYRGARRERTFETAFLEYGAMMNVVRASGGRRLVPQRPDRGQPQPLLGRLPDQLGEHARRPRCSGRRSGATRSCPGRSGSSTAATRRSIGHRKPGSSACPREPIPPAYATELMTVITALNDMEQTDIAWDCGTRGIGVVVSDTMMFQRGGPSPSDPDLGSFYGLALPLVKHGIPAEPVQLENATLPRRPRTLPGPPHDLRGDEADDARGPRGAGRLGQAGRRPRLHRRRQRPVQRASSPGGTTRPRGCPTLRRGAPLRAARPAEGCRGRDHTRSARARWSMTIEAPLRSPGRKTAPIRFSPWSVWPVSAAE